MKAALRVRREASLAAVLLSFVPAVVLAADSASGLALVVRARELSSLDTEQVGAFHLRAKVTLLGLSKGTREGTLLLVAESPEHYFRRVSFPGFEETVGAADGKLWRVRTPVNRSYRVQEAMWATLVGDHLDLPPEAAVVKTWHGDLRGAAIDCVRVSPTHLEWERGRAGQARVTPVGHDAEMHVDLCFEAATGMLLVADYGEPLPRFEFEGSVPLGSKVVPKVSRCFEANDLVAEVEVTDLAAEGEGAAGSPPRNALTWPRCAEPTPPQLVGDSRVEPSPQARSRRQMGLVVLAAEVGADGALRDVEPVNPRSAVLNAHLSLAVEKWRFRPARCGEDAVPAPVFIGVVFPP
ncbi:MAG: energy transducer TonB [Acidobacteriota bacterium]|nr:energy transducer TonB [Acidobacteriota bacterium]